MSVVTSMKLLLSIFEKIIVRKDLAFIVKAKICHEIRRNQSKVSMCIIYSSSHN